MIWHDYPAELGNLNVGAAGSKHTTWAAGSDGMIWVEVRITLGPGFTMGSFPTVKLPVPSSALAQGYQPSLGAVMYRQPSTDGVVAGLVLADNQNVDRVRLYHTKAGAVSNLGASQPWTWQVGDSIYALFAVRNWGPPLPDRATPSTAAIVGDSISATIDRNNVPVLWTWPNFAPAADLALHGGWAKGGAKLAEMLTNTTAFGADVLVVLAGTNDLGTTWGTPMSDRITQLASIVQQSQCPRVLICAVPPLDSNPTWATQWNAVLQDQATLHGWSFIDPWGPFRTPGATYVSGATSDGIHPTQATSQAIATVLHDAILAVP